MSANACGTGPPSHEEDLAQQAILAIMLDAHPAQRSIDEIVRELTDRPDEFGERDRIENAIRDLVGAGGPPERAEDVSGPPMCDHAVVLSCSNATG